MNETKAVPCDGCGRDLVLPVSGAVRTDMGHSRAFLVDGRTLCETCYTPIAARIAQEKEAALHNRARAFYREHIRDFVYHPELDACEEIIIAALVELMREL